MYQLAIAYRIYPGISEPSRGLPFDDDKLHQAELCVRSFRRATSDLRVKLWAVMDSCSPSYEQMFRRYFAPEDLVIVNLDKAGNYGTFTEQLTVLLQQDDSDFVYFAEDDYLYLDRDFGALLRFLKSGDVDFISPFDHTDDYTLRLHNFPKQVRAYEGLHWRRAASTCLTFMTTKQNLRRYEKVFRTYARGNFDVSLWLALSKYRIFNPFARFLYDPDGNFFIARGVLKAWLYSADQILFGRRARLWVPMPTFALHLDRLHSAPGFDLAAEMLKEEQRGLTPVATLERGSVSA